MLRVGRLRWLAWVGLAALLVACGRSPGTPPPSATPPPTAARAAATATSGALPTATPPGPTTPAPPPETDWLSLDRADFRLDLASYATVAEVWDFVAGETYYALNGVLVVPGGDAYAINLYERPFTPLDQDVFFPDLDIRYARLVREGDWMYALIELYGLNPGATPLTGEYGLEMDLNLDGRGDLLIWGRGPWAPEWSVAGVAVYTDPNRDVGDAQACVSDAPHRRSDGYETLAWQAGQGTLPGAAWARARLQDGRPTVEFAFPVAWVAADQPRLLWRAWADAHVHDPAAMDYHDTFTLEQAGQPYPGPLRLDALAQADNTCYTTFGFRPTGLEPCLCRVNDPFHGLCPQPPGPPGRDCDDLGADFWSCRTAEGDSAVCHWDPVFCRWDCRSLLLCPPVSRPEDLRAYLEEYLRQLAVAGVGAVAVSSETGEIALCRALPTGDLVCDEEFAEEWTPETLTCAVVVNTWFCVGGEAEELVNHPTFDLIIQYNLEEGNIESPTLRRWACAWDANLCRFECADDSWCLDPATTMHEYLDMLLRIDRNCTLDEQARRLECDYGREVQVCTFDPDYSGAVCTTQYFGPGASGEPVEARAWVYDPAACRFVERRLCVRPPLRGDCQQVDDLEWICQFWPTEDEVRTWGAPPDDWEPPVVRCRWEQEPCRWYCHPCEEPDSTCAWDENRGLWVCPGRGEFDGCEWSVDECRWRCWGAHQPETPQEEEEECQPEDYCQPVNPRSNIYQCQDGKLYVNCVYDGCLWTCEAEYP